MSDQHLPSEVEYVRDYVLTCDGHASAEDLDDFARGLSDSERKKWDEVRRRVSTGNHRQLLKTVIRQCPNGRFAALLVRFLSVCDRLDPGYDAEALPSPPSEEEVGTPDWSRLPEGLEYLIEPAQRYGIYLSEVTLDLMIDRLDDDSIEELNELVLRMKRDGDFEVLVEWFERRTGEYATCREMQMISSLLTVLNLLGHSW